VGPAYSGHCCRGHYDVIILKEKHMNLLKAVLNMFNYRIAAIEPVGSKRFVLLKYDRN